MLFRSLIKKFARLEGTDAQEYVTVKEHLYIMEKQGRIEDEDVQLIKETLEKGEELEGRLLNLILQPMKPVYAGLINDEESGTMRMVYIKSSAYPLIPQLTKGKPIAKMMPFSGKSVISPFGVHPDLEIHGDLLAPLEENLWEVLK